MKILHGDVIDQLKTISAQSINCVITSPPYFGLRNYGLPPTIWPAVNYSPMAGLPEIMVPEMTCCLGLEDTIEAYVGHLLLIFRELWRVLRGDGAVWLNLGDSYNSNASGQNGTGKTTVTGGEGKGAIQLGRHNKQTPNLKPKDLMAIPWRVALALQAEGWYLRSDVIWAKKNCLPESVRDRPTKSHEYIFLISKSKRYWYDQEAIKEEAIDPEFRTTGRQRPNGTKGVGMKGFETRGGLDQMQPNPTRNARTVWNIATSPFKEAHFAVFPPALVEKCLLAGCPSRVCVECGTPWVRVVERTGINYKTQEKIHTDKSILSTNRINRLNGKDFKAARVGTKLFTPSCQCCPLPAHKKAYRPGIVLDPFFGSGTTGVVAEQLGRDWIGIDLNPEYVEMAKQRLIKTQPVLPGIH